MSVAKLFRAFKRSVKAGDAESVAALLRDHPEIHTFEDDGGGALSVLYHDGPQLFEIAFVAGLSPDSTTVITLPLLHKAAADNNAALVALALRYGADIERRSDEGESALGFAVSWASLDLIRVLVEAGADVNGVEESPDGFRTLPLNGCTQPEIEAYLRS